LLGDRITIFQPRVAHVSWMHVGNARELLRDPERIRRTFAHAKQHVIAVPVGVET
jgi:hypothetical protein